ncbi:MAG: hypothetical protein ACRCSR_03845 [Bacteroidales bacterium]
MPIQLKNGRISTFEVFSNRLLRHITNEEKLEKHTSTQVVMGLILYPEIWERVPLIHQDDKDLANLLGSGEKHLSYRSLFDGRGRYILNSYVHLANNTPQKERTELEKQILILHEKASVLSELKQARLIPMFPLPQKDETRWVSPGEKFNDDVNADDMKEIERIFVTYLSHVTESMRTGDWTAANDYLDNILLYQTEYAEPLTVNKLKLKVEMLYGAYNWNIIIAYGYLISGSILLLLYLIRLFIHKYKIPEINKYFYIIFYIIFSIQTLSIFTQAYIYEGRFWMSHPVIMSLFAWITALVGIVFKRKSSIGLFVCIIISGLLTSLIDNHPHYIEDYRYLISQESIAVRVYYTSILCSLAILITSSLASLILIVITGLRKYIRNATDKIKELLKLSSFFTSTGLVIFAASAVTRIYISLTLTHSKSWVWVDEYKWIAITFITYVIVFVLQHLNKRKFFFVKQSASVLALIVMILSFYSLYH